MKSQVSERLKEAPAPEIIEHLYGPRADEVATVFPYMTAANKAHVVMLARQRIISRSAARKILQALLTMERRGPGCIRWDARKEDVYFNYESTLIAQVGSDAGGQMHTGRSRNDLGAALTRLQVRDAVLEFIPHLLGARRSALAQAARFAEVVMPGYTHLQPAQPITFGHYLVGIALTLERDTQRIVRAYDNTNRSPLGAAALAGTVFPVDRHSSADLLGFDGLVEHTIDAVASRDFALELMAAWAIFGVTCSRLAQDFHVWFTHEFSTIDLPDRVAGTSSIMPQKKNPIVLEHLKGKPAHLIAALVSGAAAMKNTTFTNTNDTNREGLRWLFPAYREARSCAALLRLVITSATPNAELLMERSRRDFCTATDLADMLVSRAGLSFRQAHQVVGAVVRTAMDRGLNAAEITAALINDACRAVLDRPVMLSEEVVRRALDPMRSVADRATVGGPAPREVRRMVHAATRRLEADERAQVQRVKRLAAASARLASEVQAVVRGGGTVAARRRGTA